MDSRFWHHRINTRVGMRAMHNHRMETAKSRTHLLKIVCNMPIEIIHEIEKNSRPKKYAHRHPAECYRDCIRSRILNASPKNISKVMTVVEFGEVEALIKLMKRDAKI